MNLRRYKIFIAFPIVASLLCSGFGLAAWSYLDRDGPKTPTEAIRVYFRSLQDRDPIRMTFALCKRDAEDASTIVDNFYADLAQDGVSLEDIQWRVESEQRLSNDRYIVAIARTLELRSADVIYAEKSKLSFTVVEEDGWRVCGTKT